MTTYIQKQKAALRHEMLGNLSRQFHSSQKKSAERVLQYLVQDTVFLQSKIVGLFASDPTEINTKPIFELARSLKKITVFPKVEKDLLRFYQVNQWSHLQPGYKGILEPEFGKEIQMSRVDLLFIPGVAFDFNKARLGRGKGYYDRVLASVSRPKQVVGLGYASQLVSQVPTGAWDQRVDRLLTDKGWLPS